MGAADTAKQCGLSGSIGPGGREGVMSERTAALLIVAAALLLVVWVWWQMRRKRGRDE
jgi:hypothetical protein